MATHDSTTALDFLRRLTRRDDAEFRDGQLEAIKKLVDDRGRVLCVQRTGWGKSAVYFIATAMLRGRGAGPTILVSPLIALMRNQLVAAEALGIHAATVNSSNRDDWDETFDRIDRDQVDLLLLSPERLANQGFQANVLPKLVARTGLLVIDEAHCISDWGHDFRPDYRRIAAIAARLPERCAVLATTATANDRVIADVTAQLGGGGGEGLHTIRGTLDRPSLRLEVCDLPSQAERLAWLATYVPRLEGSGIVYCLTVRDTQNVSNWLRSQGIGCEAYSGRADSEERVEIERRLLANELKCVVATSALGMGYDKPDLGFVVHFQGPGSPIAYYQQVGRAGRGLEHADAVLLRGAEDRQIQDCFIRSSFPSAELVGKAMAIGGSAVGVLAHPLTRTVREGSVAERIDQGCTVLVTQVLAIGQLPRRRGDGAEQGRVRARPSHDRRRLRPRYRRHLGRCQGGAGNLEAVASPSGAAKARGRGTPSPNRSARRRSGSPPPPSRSPSRPGRCR